MKAAADALGYFVGQGGHGAAAAAAVEYYRQFQNTGARLTATG
jgi:hypothetical protein